jgi:hypothetical protein
MEDSLKSTQREMPGVAIIVLCPDCQKSCKPENTIKICRPMPEHSWKAIQTLCKNCGDKAIALGAEISN